MTEQYGIPVFETHSYGLKDEETARFFDGNEFEIGISMGWQRLIPQSVLDRFAHGIFGFHGSCGYLPYGRGRSPLNWSVINGDTRFILNLFQYDADPDSPNVFANEMFSINPHDTIRTLQPLSRTRIWSASTTVRRRWAIIITVLPSTSLAIAF